jgi:hypothetical protein
VTNRTDQPVVKIPGKRGSYQLYVKRSENPRALLDSVRKEMEAMTGVPSMSLAQAAVGAWRDWLRMRREAAKEGR